jgi:thiol-disulfide isomerase/thioredoxin
METLALTGGADIGGRAAAVRHCAPDAAGRGGRRQPKDARSALHRVLGPLVLLGWLLLVVGCESRPGRAQGADQDPFKQLDLTRVTPPTPAPVFTVLSPAGRSLSLTDVKGSVVLLNFWATWCPPCREEMPSMERLYQRYRDRGFTVLALSIDRNLAAVPPFVEGFRLTFPIGLAAKTAVAELYRVRALPTTVLIDRAGQVIAGAAGARDWDSPAAHAVVETLLK